MKPIELGVVVGLVDWHNHDEGMAIGIGLLGRLQGFV